MAKSGRAARSPLKSKPLRVPGESLDRQLQNLIDDKLAFWFFAPAFLWILTGLEWFFMVRNMPRKPWTFAAAALVLTVIGAVRFVQIRRQARNLKLGRDGERVVGQHLDGLRVDGARVFHDIPGEDFNLDHVVISPRGIYVVETKTISKPHPDAKVTLGPEQLLVDGRPLSRDPIKQVRAEAGWLRQQLEEGTGKRFDVRGVVVFPGWFVDAVPGGAKGMTWVLEPKALEKWIQQQPIELTSEDVKLAAYFLSRYVRSAWGPR